MVDPTSAGKFLQIIISLIATGRHEEAASLVDQLSPTEAKHLILHIANAQAH